MLVLGILSAIAGLLLIGLAPYLVIDFYLLGGWADWPSEWSTGTSFYFVGVLSICAFPGGLLSADYAVKLLRRMRQRRES